MVRARTLRGIHHNLDKISADLVKHGFPPSKSRAEIRAEMKAEADAKYEALGAENRRAMMAEFRKGGKENTIGEVARRYGVETMVMADLVCRNIDDHHLYTLKLQSEVE